MIVLALSLFLLLNLLGACLLFRFLKALVPVKARTCRESRAIGGFVAVHGTLFDSYYKIASLGLTITHKLSPTLPGAMIVLAVREGYAL